tara:strand:- start:1456 stop:1728 length:273 start_codon:yes stop_codon:yes gene_type:complete
MAFKKIKAKMAARKKLKTYKKKVKSSKLYKKTAAGAKQKKIDVLARKRKLGLGIKKNVQKKINKLSKKKPAKKKRSGVKTPVYSSKKKYI